MDTVGKSEANQPLESAKVPRRTLLLTALFFGVTALLVKITGVLFSFLKPPVKKNSYGGIIQLGTLAELPGQGAPPKHIPEGRFWLVHAEQGVSALHSSCTHLDCLFTWDEQKQLFVCPCHGSEFATDGTVLKGPATRSLDRFPVSVVDGNNNLMRGSTKELADPVEVLDLLEASHVDEPQEDGDSSKKQLAFVQVDTGQKIIGMDKSL